MSEDENSSPSETQRASDVTPQRGTPTEDAASQRDTAGEVQDPEKKKLHDEAASYRTRARDLEAQLKVYQAAEEQAKEAKLSEIDRVKKQHADTQAKHDALLAEVAELKIQRAVERLASELGFHHPEIAVKLVERSALEYDEQGTPKNVKPLLEKLKKSMPELARAETPEPTQQQQQPTQQQHVPALPAMGMNGRSSIPAPGQQPTGKPTRLEDLQWSR